MKKKAELLLAVMCILFITGCGVSYDVETSTVFVDKKGKITEVSVESFDKDYYDKDELKEFVEEHIEAYHEQYGKDRVKIDKLTVEDGVASLKMEYSSAEDYSVFNGEEFFCGTLPEAMAAGYDFTDTYYVIADKEPGERVDRDDFLDNPDLKVVIMRQGINVTVPGEIKYVSGYLTLVDKDTVMPTDDYFLQELGTAITIIYE